MRLYGQSRYHDRPDHRNRKSLLILNALHFKTPRWAPALDSSISALFDACGNGRAWNAHRDETGIRDLLKWLEPGGRTGHPSGDPWSGRRGGLKLGSRGENPLGRGSLIRLLLECR